LKNYKPLTTNILVKYVENLLEKGSNIPVDIDATYKLELPQWADEVKMKRYL
jgi:hypothetical protein